MDVLYAPRGTRAKRVASVPPPVGKFLCCLAARTAPFALPRGRGSVTYSRSTRASPAVCRLEFSRGERFVNRPLGREEFAEVLESVGRWGLDDYLKERSFDNLIYR
jgi:hypothetical protein